MERTGSCKTEINRSSSITGSVAFQLIIIPVEDNRTFRIHVVCHGTLFLQDSVSCSKILKMCISDISDHAHIRAGDLSQWFHISKVADSHLKNCNLMFLTDIEYGQRKSNLIIEVSFCFQYIIFLGKYRCDHFFCACLSNTSSDTYNFDIEGTAIVFS